MDSFSATSAAQDGSLDHSHNLAIKNPGGNSGKKVSGECRIAIEIVSLGVVIVIVELLLTLPILFYHLPVNIEENVSLVHII